MNAETATALANAMAGLWRIEFCSPKCAKG